MNEQVKHFDFNNCLEIALISVLGSRSEQQDRAGYELKAEDGAFVVCDGMGGLRVGSLASSTAVQLFLKQWNETYPAADLRDKLCDAVIEIDSLVASLKNEEGEPLYAGTTISAVIVQKRHLNWVSVGDSRIYLFRKDQLIQITEDHNYRYVLEQQLRDKQITEERYKEEAEKSESLVSYIGMGGLAFIDSNEKPILLKAEDRILICSDGLYKQVSDEEICNVLGNISNIDNALDALKQKAERRERSSKKPMDNTTILLIRIKEDGEQI